MAPPVRGVTITYITPYTLSYISYITHPRVHKRFSLPGYPTLAGHESSNIQLSTEHNRRMGLKRYRVHKVQFKLYHSTTEGPQDRGYTSFVYTFVYPVLKIGTSRLTILLYCKQYIPASCILIYCSVLCKSIYSVLSENICFNGHLFAFVLLL